MQKRVLLIIMMVCITAVSVSALAGDNPDKEAVAAFREGIDLFSAGKYAEAADAFRRANTIKFNWKLLYNIGQSEAAARRHGLALQVFEEYLARGGDDVPMERRNEVRNEIRRLREMTGFLEITGPGGALIFVDGVERDKLPISGPIMIAAGVSHEVVVRSGAETIMTRSVRVAGEQTFRIDATAPSSGETAEVKDTSPDAAAQNNTAPADDSKPVQETTTGGDGGKKLRLAGWITTGVGAAVLATGGITGAMALVKGKDLEAKYDGVEVPQSASGEVDTINALAMTSTVTLITGGLVATTGVILIILGAKKKEAVVTGAPMLHAHGAGFMLGGTF